MLAVPATKKLRRISGLLVVAASVLLTNCSLDELVSPTPGGVLTVAPLELADSARVGSTARRTRTVTLGVQGATTPMTFGVTAELGSTWIVEGLGTGTAPNDWTIGFDPSGLAVGEYRDTLRVSNDGPDSRLIRVPVLLRILPCDIVDLGTLPAAELGELTAEDCASTSQTDRFAKRFRFTGAVNDSVTLRVLSTDFTPRVTIRRTGAMTPIGFADTCPAAGSGACTRYVRLTESGTYEVEVTSTTANATGDFELRVAAPRAPAAPSTLSQRVATDLTQSIAAGATLNTDRIALQASLTDADLDSLRLEIELRPIGTAFTNAPTSTSALLPGPTFTQTLLGLTDNTVYRWQARAVDVTGRASAWVAFGGGTADFSIGVPEAPLAPSAMVQRKVDGSTPIALGGTTDESIIQLGATVNDPDPADQVRLELEVRPFGTAFSSVATHSSAAQAPGTSALVSVAGLVDNGQYRWQSRTVDQTGRTSAWTPFGGASTHFRVTLTPARLSFLTGPTAAAAGAAITPSVRVAVQGADGSTLASYTGPVTLALDNANGATLGGTTTINAVAGVATFTDLSVDRAGTGYTLTARAGTLNETSAAFSVTAAAAANLSISAVPATVTAGVTIAPALTVTVRDALGNVASGFTGTVSLALAANADDAVLIGTTSVAAVAGVATFSDVRVERASSALTIVASVTGLANVSSTPFAVTAASAAELVLIAEPATTAASGVVLGQQPVLEIRDGFGNPVRVAGTVVTATIASGPGGSSLTGATVNTGADGRATFSALAIVGAAGSYTLQFSAGALTAAPAAPITIAAGVATQLALSVAPPATAVNGLPFGVEVRARLRDAAGNPVLQAGVSVSVSVASGAGTLTGTTTVLTNTMGQAIFSDLALLGVVGARTLAFTSSGLSGVTSGTVTLVAGAATTLALQAGDGQSAAATGTVSIPPAVIARDVSGNPVGGVSVTFAVASGGGVIVPPGVVVTGANGIAALSTWTLGGTAGPNTLTASVDGLDGSPVLFTATATAGAASQITVTGGDDLTGPVATTLGTPHEVRITDATGNPVAGVTVNWSAIGGGSVAPASSVTDADGRASTVRTLGSTAGAQSTQASATLAGGLTSVTFNITASVGGATQLTLVTGDAQVDTVGATLATPLTVLVRDALNNPVPGVQITWSVLAGGGAVTPTTSLTNASGIATTSWRLGTTRTATDSTQIVRASGVASPLTFIALSRAGAVNASQTLVSVTPSSVAASRGTPATVTVTARDGFGNPVAGVPVTIAATGSGNTIVQPVGLTSANGVATGAIGATVTGARTISATANAVPVTATATLTVVAAPAATLLFLDAPSTAVAGGDLTPSPSIGVADSLGNRNFTFTGSVTLGLGVNPNGGALSGTLSRNAVAGVATFTGVAIDRAGAGYQLSAAGTGLVTAQSAALSVSAGAVSAARSTVSAAPTSITAGSGTSSITVTARDANDNPIAGATVVLSASGSNNSLTQPVAVTDANGIATGTISATSSGNRTISATIAGVSITQTAVVSVVAGAVSPSLSTITGIPSTLVAGVETSNVTVTARDALGNAIAGATVVISATGAGNTITQPAGLTNASGVALGSFVSTVAEAKVLSATINGVAVSTSANVTVNPGAVSASRSLVAAAPDSIVAAEGTSTITVTARDANDNLISGAAVVLAASGAGNTLTQPAGSTAGNGRTTGSLGSTVVGNKTVTATINGTAITQSAVVRVFSAGVSASQSAVEVAAASIVAGDSTTITVIARDANGNAVSGALVVLASNGAGDVVRQPLAVTAVDGVATGRVRATSAGARTISATIAGVSITQTVALTVTPSVPNASESSLSVAPTSIAADGTTATITVTVRDEFGNAVPSVTVALAATGTGNALTQPGAVTNASGVATGSISATIAGTREISATAGGLALDETATLTVTPASVSAAQSTVSVAPGSFVAGAGSSTVTVVARDANGNVVPGLAVTFAASGSGNTLTQPAAVTDGTGSATGSISSTGAGAKTITATIAGVAVTQTASLTVAPAAISAATSTVAVSAGTISAGVGTTTVTVTVRDAFSNPIPGVSVVLAATGSSNTLTQPASVTNASGVATGSFGSTNSESKTISATAGVTAVTQTATVNVVPDAASASASLVVASATSLIAGTDTATITVTARDANNNPVPGVAVTLAATGTGITFVQPAAVTGTNGVAIGRVSGTVVGARTVTASLNGVAATTTIGLSITPAPVSGDSTRIVIAPPSIVAGASTAVVTVTARDAFGNVVPGVTVALGATGASASLTQPTEVTDAAGVTTGGITATLVGPKIVSAAVNGAPVTMTDTLAVTPATVAAAQSTIGASPTAITAGGAASTITVTARDEFGNVVPGLAVTLSANGSSNTFVQPAAVTNASGVATGTLASTATGVRTVSASIAGTPVTATTSVTVNPAAVSASLSTVGADPSSIVAGGTPSTITVQVRDLFGNPVPGATVLLIANGANNTVNQPAVTDADGLTSGTLASLTAQVKSVTAIANGVTLAGGVDVTVTAGAVNANNSTLVATPDALVAGAGSSTVTVTARDANNNLIPGAAVVLFATGGGNTLTQPSGNTGADGVASGALSSTVAGVKTVTATVNGVLLTASDVVTVSAAAINGTQSTLAIDPSSIVADGAATSTATVTVRDQFGNPVAGATVVVSADPGNNVTIAGPGAVTNALGSATASITSTASGVKTVSATAGGVSITQTQALTVTPGAVSASLSTVGTSAASIVAGSGTSTVTVTARDGEGNLIPNAAVTLGATGSGNSFAPNASGNTDSNGEFTAIFSSTEAVAKTISATIASVAITSTAAVTVTPAAAAAATSQITASPTTVSSDVGTSVVTVALRDAFNNPLTGGTDVVTLSTTRGAFGVVTNSGNGTYVATLTATTAGAAEISGSVNGETIADTATVTITSGGVSSAQSTLAASSSTLVAGDPAVTITVTARDATGNPVAGALVVLGATGDGVSVTQPLAVTDANGVATGSVAATLVGSKVVSATIAGISISQTAGITVTPAAPSTATTTIVATSTSITVDATTLVTVQARDQYGNALTTSGGTVALATTLGALTGVTDNLNGTYSATLSSTLPGTASVTGSIAGNAIADGESVLFSVGATSLVASDVIATPTTFAAGASSAITVQLRDQYGNARNSGGNNITIVTSFGSVSATTNNGNGTYSATLTSNVSGTARVSARLNAQPFADTVDVVITAAAVDAGTTTVVVDPASIVAGEAGSTITVTARDAFGNVVPSANVVFEATGAGNTLTPSATANSGGVATGTLTSTATGVKVVSATVNGTAITQTANVTVTPAAASLTLSTLTASPTSITTDQSSAISVQLRDAFDNAVTSSGGEVVLSTTVGTVGTVTNNNNGTYTATLTSQVPGTATVTGTLGGAAIADNAVITVTSGAVSAASSTVAVSPTSIVAGTATSTVTITALDQFGNPVEGVVASFVSSGTGNTLVQPVGTTDANGIATGTISSTVAQQKSITGTAGAVQITTPAVLTVTPAAVSATTSTLSAGTASIAASSGANTSTITLTARDEFSNLIESAAVTFSATGTVNSFAPASGTTNAAGVLTTAFSSETAEAKTISAVVAGTTVTQTAAVSVTPAAASALTSQITANPTSVSSDVGTSTLTVTLRDAFSNALVDGGASVEILSTLGTVGTVSDLGNGTYTATLTATTAGTAEISGEVNNAAITDTATVTITSGGVSAAQSSVQVSSATLVAGAAAVTITVTARDAAGNPVAGAAVVIGATGTNSLTPPAAVTNAAGVATGLISATVVGTNQISATAAGVAITETATVTVTPAAASTATSTITANSNSITTDGNATLTVQLRDQYSNLVTESGGTVTLTPSFGTIGVVTDNANGTYSAVFTSGTLGNASISGTLESVLITDTEAITVTVGNSAPSTTTITAADAAITAGGSTTLTVQLRDAAGNARTTSNGTIELFATIGSITNLTDVGDGTWTATFTSNAAGSATISGELNDVALTDTEAVTVNAAAVSASASTVTAGSPSIVAGSGTSLITVTALDQFSNPVVGAPVTFTTSGSGNTFAPSASATTDANGQATATFSSTEAIPKDIVATVGTTEITQQPTVTVTPAAIDAGTSTVVLTPTSVAATVSSTVTVTALDAFNNPVSGATVTFSATGDGNTLTQPAAVTDANGVATGSISSTDAGSKVITAIAGGTTITQAPTLTVTAGGVSGTNSSISVDPGTITASTGTSATTVTVTARDASNNPIEGLAVVLSAAGTGDQVTQPGATTDANGVATGSFYSTGAGAKSVSATIDGVAVTTSASVTVEPAAISAAQSLVSANPTSLEAGADTSVITITVRDQFSNPIAGTTVTLGASGGTGNSTIDPVASTDAAGQTTGRFTSTTTGAKTVTATAGATPITQTAAITVTPGPVSASLSTVATGTATIEAGPETSTITVTVRDTLGNLVPNATVAFSATGSDNTLTDEDVTDANGVATATFSSTRAEAKTITAVASGVTLTQTAAVTVTPAAVDGAASTISALPLSIEAGVETSTITVTALDEFLNPVPGVPVVVSATGTGNTITGSGANTNAAGVVTVTLESTDAGTKTVTATADGVSLVDDVDVAVTVGGVSATQSTVVAQQTSIVANNDGSATSTILITALDANDNPIAGATVTLSATGSNNVFVQPAVTDANGQTSGTIRSITAELKTVTATISGVPITQVPTVTVIAAAASAAQSIISANPTSITTDGSSTITVQARDAFGNNRTSTSGTVLLNSSIGGALSVTDNTNGTYIATLSPSTTGTASITGTLGDVAIGTGASVTVTPGEPSGAVSTIALDPASITASSGSSTSTITATARDADGNVIPGATVVISATGTGNTLTQAVTTADGDGEVTATFSSTIAEVKTISAEINGTVAITPSASLTVGVGAVDAAASDLVVSAASIGASNGSESSTITATIRDGNNNPISGVTVSFFANGVTTGLSAATALTNGSGVASVTFSSTATGLRNITASANAVTLSDAPSITVTPAAFSAANSTLGVSPSSITAGTESSAITVTVLDIFSNPIPGVDVVLAATGNENSLTQPAAVTNAAGVATGSLSSTEAGVKTVSATADLAAITQTQDVTVTAGDVSVSVSTLEVSAPSIIASIGANTSTITATILDANENPISGVTVNFLVDAATTGLSAANAVTNGAGVAEVTYSSTSAGVRTVTASVGVAQLDDEPTITVTPAAASLTESLIIASDESITSDETSIITVRLRDEFSNNLTASAGTVTLSASPGGALTVTPAGDGTYTATFDGATATTVTITGALDAVNFTDNAVITVSVGAVSASQSLLDVDLNSITAGSGTSTITVTARDGANNLIQNVTVVLGVTGATGTLTQPSGNTNASGVATGTFTDTIAGPQTISATVGGVLINATQVVTVQPGAASAATSTITASAGTITAGDNTTITIQAKDAWGNNATGITDDFSLATDLGSLGTVTSASPGVYTATFTSNTAGTASITGQLGATAMTDTESVVVEAGAATQLVFVTQPDTTAASQPIATFTVEARDINGNVDPTYVGAALIVIETATGADGAVLSGTTTPSAVAGVITFTGLSINLVGVDYQLRVTSGSLTFALSTVFDITP